MSSAQKLAIGILSLPLVISLLLLSATFASKGLIKKAIISYTAKKTHSKVEEQVNKLTQSRLYKTRKLLPKKTREHIENELAEYRSNPESYLIHLATTAKQKSSTSAGIAKLKEKIKIKKNAFTDWKQKISRSLDQSIHDLIIDFRIFNTTNIVVCLLLLLSIVKANKLRPWHWFFIVLLIVSTLFASSIYIKQNWLLNIISGSHMGWLYPITLFGLFAYLSLRVGGEMALHQIGEKNSLKK